MRLGQLAAMMTTLVLWSALSSLLGAQQTLAISAEKIYVGDGTIIEKGVIIVSGGKILAIGPGSQIEIPRGTRRLRVRGSVTPGFIDAAADALLGASKDEQSSEVTPEGRAIDGLDFGSLLMKRLAREGVTTVYATAGNSAVITAQGATVKTGTGDVQNRILTRDGAPKLVLISGPERGNARPRNPAGISDFTRLPLGRMGGIFVARSALGQAKDRLRIAKAGGKVAKNAAFDVLGEVLSGKRRMRVLARRQNEVSTASRLAKEFGFSYVIEQGNEAYKNIRELKRDHAAVIYGPMRSSSPSMAGVSRQLRRFFTDPNLNKILSTPRVLIDAKIPTALTAGGNTGEYGLARQAMLAMRCGLSRAEALAAVTTVPAQLLGVQDRVGTLKVGRDADLIVWSGEPLDATSIQSHVFIGGRRVAGKVF
ncbi:MAG: amidohydrolase family protein [Planctomycetota bacterium]